MCLENILFVTRLLAKARIVRKSGNSVVNRCQSVCVCVTGAHFVPVCDTNGDQCDATKANEMNDDHLL